MQSHRVKPSWFLTSPLLNSALVPTHSFPPCQQTTCLYWQPRSPSNNATSLLNSPMTLFPHRDKVQSPYGNHRGSPSPPRPAPSLILPLNQFSLLLLAHLVVIWKETQQATSSGACPWYHVWLVGPIQCPRHTALLHSGLFLPRALSCKQHICKPRYTLVSPPHPISQGYYQPVCSLPSTLYCKSHNGGALLVLCPTSVNWGLWQV